MKKIIVELVQRLVSRFCVHTCDRIKDKHSVIITLSDIYVNKALKC